MDALTPEQLHAIEYNFDRLAFTKDMEADEKNTYLLQASPDNPNYDSVVKEKKRLDDIARVARAGSIAADHLRDLKINPPKLTKGFADSTKNNLIRNLGSGPQIFRRPPYFRSKQKE